MKVFFSLPSDNTNIGKDRGPVNLDQRHRVSASVNWEIRSGIQLFALYQIDSPLPFTRTTGFDDNGDTNFNDRPPGVKRNSERGTWKQRLDLNMSWTFSFINRAPDSSNRTFSVITSSSEGGVSATRSDKRFSLRFFINAENLFNTTNFNNFVGVQTSPLFGQPTSAENPRRISAGIRFNF